MFLSIIYWFTIKTRLTQNWGCRKMGLWTEPISLYDLKSNILIAFNIFSKIALWSILKRECGETSLPDGYILKRKFLIYFAISLLTIPCDFSIDIIKNEREIETIKTKIDLIYKQIKKNEITPNTAYLFNKLNAGNLEKTITKLELLNKLPVFLPRKN